MTATFQLFESRRGITVRFARLRTARAGGLLPRTCKRTAVGARVLTPTLTPLGPVETLHAREPIVNKPHVSGTGGAALRREKPSARPDLPGRSTGSVQLSAVRNVTRRDRC